MFDAGTVLLHASDQRLLAPVLVAAGLLSAAVVALATAAFARRRSTPYLLVTLALATLLARTGLGVLTAGDWLAAPAHHLLEHSLDALAVLLLVGAVYLARSANPRGGEFGE